MPYNPNDRGNSPYSRNSLQNTTQDRQRGGDGDVVVDINKGSVDDRISADADVNQYHRQRQLENPNYHYDQTFVDRTPLDYETSAGDPSLVDNRAQEQLNRGLSQFQTLPTIDSNSYANSDRGRFNAARVDSSNSYDRIQEDALSSGVSRYAKPQLAALERARGRNLGDAQRASDQGLQRNLNSISGGVSGLGAGGAERASRRAGVDRGNQVRNVQRGYDQGVERVLAADGAARRGDLRALSGLDVGQAGYEQDSRKSNAGTERELLGYGLKADQNNLNVGRDVTRDLLRYGNSNEQYNSNNINQRDENDIKRGIEQQNKRFDAGVIDNENNINRQRFILAHNNQGKQKTHEINQAVIDQFNETKAGVQAADRQDRERR